MEIIREHGPGAAIDDVDVDVDGLRRLLAEHPELRSARLRNDDCGDERSLLHVVADWPGHFPNSVAMIRRLGGGRGRPERTVRWSAHRDAADWAASSDDVEVIDALLEQGADIEASGAVIAGATPLADAVAFGQWNAARRLVERGHRPVAGKQPSSASPNASISS